MARDFDTIVDESVQHNRLESIPDVNKIWILRAFDAIINESVHDIYAQLEHTPYVDKLYLLTDAHMSHVEWWKLVEFNVINFNDNKRNGFHRSVISYMVSTNFAKAMDAIREFIERLNPL